MHRLRTPPGRISLAFLAVTGLIVSCSFTRPPASNTAPLLAPDVRLRAAQSTSVHHRPDGTVLVNNTPFFPFGFYHVSWAQGGTTSQRLKDLQKISKAGFNLVVTEPINDEDVDSFQSFLGQAQQAGVFVMTYGMPATAMPMLRQNPAVLGFKIADDVNANFTAQQVLNLNNALKKSSPNKLTYVSLSVAMNRPETPYFASADLIGNQSYPVGNDNINVTYYTMRSAVDSALSKGSVPIANLQSFDWGKQKPSPQEIRNMTYQALMAGVRGIVYYAYRSVEVDQNREPQMWSALQGLSQEVALLSPYLLNGTLTPLSDGRGTRPLAVYLQGQDELGQRRAFVLALNNRKTNVNVNLALTEKPVTWVPFHTPSNTMRQTGSSVTGQLKPLQVAIYQAR